MDLGDRAWTLHRIELTSQEQGIHFSLIFSVHPLEWADAQVKLTRLYALSLVPARISAREHVSLSSSKGRQPTRLMKGVDK